MDFRPISGEHSVQSAVFTVFFDGAVHPSAVQYLQTRSDLLRDLPAVQQPQAIEMLMTGTAPVSRPLSGVQLSHLRPDGSAAWALRLVGNELSVECTRYTRWRTVWKAAQAYLMAGLEAAGTRKENGRKVAVLGHNVLDVFVAQADPYNLSTLLKPSDLVAPKIFVAGSTWHNHVGWFEPLNAGNVAWLIQVNIDAVRGPPGPLPAQTELRVQIMHNQELRFTAPVAIDELTGELDARMNKLHLMNKHILSELLTAEMARQIGLGEQNESA